jgi:hypothetical protein
MVNNFSLISLTPLMCQLNEKLVFPHVVEVRLSFDLSLCSVLPPRHLGRQLRDSVSQNEIKQKHALSKGSHNGCCH